MPPRNGKKTSICGGIFKNCNCCRIKIIVPEFYRKNHQHFPRGGRNSNTSGNEWNYKSWLVIGNRWPCSWKCVSIYLCWQNRTVQHPDGRRTDQIIRRVITPSSETTRWFNSNVYGKFRTCRRKRACMAPWVLVPPPAPWVWHPGFSLQTQRRPAALREN